MEKKQFKDEGMRSLFQAMDEKGPSFGMDERIMRAIAQDATQQARVRKNLRRAMLGVGISLAVMLFFVLGTGSIFDSNIIEVAGQSVNYSILLSFVGLVLLFVQVELIVKYWLNRRFAEE